MGDTTSRRGLLRATAILLPLGLTPARLLAQAPQARELRFFHTHTSERLRVTYAENGRYVPEALAEVNHLLRDFRSGEVHDIDPRLLDILHETRRLTGSSARFEIISGFRSPATNEMLRSTSSGVAQKSLHMQGQAIDVRLSGTPTAQLRRAALSLARGGVGYYPKSDFVHLDTGRVRSW